MMHQLLKYDRETLREIKKKLLALKQLLDPDQDIILGNMELLAATVKKTNQNLSNGGKHAMMSPAKQHCNRLALLVITLSLALLCLSCSSQPPLPPLAADAVILAFGDSLTFGTGAQPNQSYPAVLAGLTGRKVVNAGIPGEVSSEGLKRLSATLDETLPALLVLCHGGNDLLRKQSQDELRRNLREMVQLARGRGVAVMLIAVPEPNLAVKPPALYAEVAREFSLPLEEDILADIVTTRKLKSDHVHPNAEGYRRLAEAVAKVLRKSGALR